MSETTPRLITNGPIRIGVAYRTVVIDATETAAQKEYLPEAHGILTLTKAEALCLLSALADALMGTRR